MNLLDENFPDDQTPVFREWRIPFRQIGGNVGSLGLGDSDIIALLHRLRRVTFFTLDRDFFRLRLCHPAYCLVWLDAPADDASAFVRRFLRHPRFDSQAKRLGVVARVHPGGIHFWQRGRTALRAVGWPGGTLYP